MPTIKKFTELESWQLANELEKKMYEQLISGTLQRDFALRDQINKSVGSIPDNIAEGFGRGGRNEFVQFLSFARASASELQSQIIRCHNRNHFSKEVHDELFELTDKVGNKIGAFIKYLNQSTYSGLKFQNRVATSNDQQIIGNKQSATESTLQSNTPNEKQEISNNQLAKESALQTNTSNEQQTNDNRQLTNESTTQTNAPNEKQTTIKSAQLPYTPNEELTTRNEHSTMNEIIKTTSAATPLGAYPHARKVGNLLFLSGIGSRSAVDNSIPGLQQDDELNIISYDIEAECRQCFANVKAVLEASGSSWDNIVDVTVFLTNMKKDFPAYNKIYGEYFAKVEACRTTVEVKSLPTPIAIELKVIATVD